MKETERKGLTDSSERIEWEKRRGIELISSASCNLREHGKDELAELLERLYGNAVPYLERARHGNPIHHTAQVTEFLVRIILGKGCLTDVDRRRLIATGVFHDSGFANIPANEEKITKRMIDLVGDPVGKEAVRRKAVELRVKHAVEGARIAQVVLNDVGGFSIDDIGIVMRIIEKHDNPSIAELEEDPQKKKQWLFTSNEFLECTHREADRLWMLSVDGIKADLERDRAKGKTTPAEEMIRHNIQRHEEEKELYDEVFTDEFELGAFGFKDGCAFYRTAVGKQLFQGLPRETIEFFKAEESI